MISSVTKRKVLFRSLVSVSLMGLASGCFSTASADGDRAETDGEFTAPRCISSEDADALEDQVLQLINLERAALDEDLAPVVVSPTLGKIAATFGRAEVFRTYRPAYRPRAGRARRCRRLCVFLRRGKPGGRGIHRGGSHAVMDGKPRASSHNLGSQVEGSWDRRSLRDRQLNLLGARVR
jgi:hypothetical protein